MNRDETIEAIRVMQAWIDGKRIQGRPKPWADESNVWEDVIDPGWYLGKFEYRVKPEPRVIYVNEYGSGLSNTHHMSKQEANLNAASSEISTRNIRKFIEVIE